MLSGTTLIADLDSSVSFFKEKVTLFTKAKIANIFTNAQKRLYIFLYILKPFKKTVSNLREFEILAIRFLYNLDQKPEGAFKNLCSFIQYLTHRGCYYKHFSEKEGFEAIDE